MTSKEIIKHLKEAEDEILNARRVSMEIDHDENICSHDKSNKQVAIYGFACGFALGKINRILEALE